MYYKLVNDTCSNSLTVFESLTTCRPYNLLTGVALCISSFYGIPLMAYMTWQLGHLKFKKSSYYIWVFLQTLCDLTSLTTDSLRFGDSDYTLSDVSAIACELSLTANTGISLEWKKQLREWKIVDRLLWIASVTCVVILIPCQLSYTAAYYTEASPLLYNFTLLLQDVNLIILPVWAFVSAGITYLCLFAVVIVDKKTFSTVTMKGYKKVAFALTVKTILYSDMYLMPYSVGRILGAFNWLNVAEGEWFNLLPPSITRYLYPTCNAILNYWAMRGLWRKTSVVALRSRNSTSTQHTPRTPRIVVNSPQTF